MVLGSPSVHRLQADPGKNNKALNFSSTLTWKDQKLKCGAPEKFPSEVISFTLAFHHFDG